MSVINKACTFIYQQATDMKIEDKAKPFTLFPVFARERKVMPKSMQNRIK